MIAVAAVIAGLVVGTSLVYALDRLFRPRGETLGDLESYGDSAGGDGAFDGGGD